jgi:hypothetical protein
VGEMVTCSLMAGVLARLVLITRGDHLEIVTWFENVSVPNWRAIA